MSINRDTPPGTRVKIVAGGWTTEQRALMYEIVRVRWKVTEITPVNGLEVLYEIRTDHLALATVLDDMVAAL